MHRPSSASTRCLLNPTNAPGLDMMLTPPASASELSPVRSDCTARCRATSDEEHAVSRVTAGPSSPSR